MATAKISEWRAPGNYDTGKASADACLPFSEYGESMTVQSQMEDADLNVIMKRFGITGKMPENPRVPQYGDFTQVGDYRSALDAVRTADMNFALLPAEARQRFNNNPQLLLEFVSDPANIDESIRLGLRKKPEVKRDGSGAQPVPVPGSNAGEPSKAPAGGVGGN